MVEYALLVGLIAIVSLVAVNSVGAATDQRFDTVAIGLSADSPSTPADDESTPSSPTTTAPAAPPTTAPATTTTTAPAAPPTTAPAPVVPGSTVGNTGSTSSYYWWNTTKGGGEGAWKASASYHNEWIRHQYLTLEVTRTDENGKVTTTQVNDFYVPAGGRTTFELWDNTMSVNNSTVKGVVSVTVKVTAIRTSDEKWQTVSYTTDGPTTVVKAPSTP